MQSVLADEEIAFIGVSKAEGHKILFMSTPCLDACQDRLLLEHILSNMRECCESTLNLVVPYGCIWYQDNDGNWKDDVNHKKAANIFS